LLHVGWLERGHPVPPGDVDETSIARLGELCANSKVAITRGRYRCQLPDCPAPERFADVELHGVAVPLGSAEIWVPGRDSVWYAAPDLVYHYVTAHGYRPPDEFLAAIHGERAGAFTETEWRALKPRRRAAGV
jgi:hypothetical protein